MKKIKGIFLILFLLFPFKVSADDFSLSVNCPSSVAPGVGFSCTVSVSSSTVITNLTANYDLSGNSSGVFNYSDASGVSNGNIGTINLSIPADAVSNHEYIVNFSSISANGGSLTSSDKSQRVRVKSNENRLESLTLSSGSISFNSDITTYNNIVVDSNISTIEINAVAKDSNATITGTGTISLAYGSNPIAVKVTPEIGEAKTYNLTIVRTDPRSKNNNVSSIFVTNTDIDFKKDVMTYNLTTTSSEVNISVAREDTTATVTGDGKHQLEIGMNKILVVITAQNQDKKTYTININRKDSRSDNNYLKNITLSSGTLNFNKTTTTYNVTVEKDVEKIKISATLDDSKAKFADKYGPREVGLKEGNNSFELRVINEKGEQRTYTININRKDGKSSDSTLKSIELSEGKIDFDKDKLEYKVNVEYDIKKIKVKAVANSDKAKVTIDGDGELKLGANDIKIVVEAENGQKTTYKVTVVRKEQGYKLSSDNYITSLVIKDHELDFSSDTYSYTINTKENKLDIFVKLEDSKAKYEILGNKSLKNGSKIIIKVTAENGDIREYTLNIEKPNNTVVILIIILVTLITAGIVTIVILNMKKKKRLFEKSEDNEIITQEKKPIDDDFTQV